MVWLPENSIPVTVVSGFSGAGKSALINQLRSELGSASDDCLFLYDDGEKDLLADLEEAMEGRQFQLIVIECAPHMEPGFVVELLIRGDEQGPAPEGVQLDTLVTVVDATTFLADVLSSEDLMERGLAFEALEGGDDRAIAEVLIEQAEFADVIIINKTDLVDQIKLAQVEALLARLNPRARLVKAVHGRVPAHQLVRTGLFDINETEEGVGWLAELQGDFDELGEVSGVSSFTYLERRPFHPIRFNEMLADLEAPGLVRAKGSVWVATRHHEIGVWALAGPASMLGYGGAWFAATPAREWPEDPEVRMEIMQDWVPPFGDRRQEIAFIGVKMDIEEIRGALDECLLTDEEMKDGPMSWDSISDPLPDWHGDTDPEIFGGGTDILI